MPFAVAGRDGPGGWRHERSRVQRSPGGWAGLRTDRHLDIMNRLGVAALSSAETVNFLHEIIREI
jgi:hypothetical protein